MRVDIKLKNGRVMRTTEAVARVMRNRRLTAEDYQTTQMVSDGLDGLTAEELHALAKERGVSVHHRAGADKVRAALRGE
jgi:transposase